MNLGELWQWEKRKLGCRIREESGNPAADEVREQLNRLSMVETNQKNQKNQKKDGKDNSKRKGGSSIKKKQLRPLGIRGALMAYEEEEKKRREAMPLSRQNIHKRFYDIPRNPPTKLIMDMQKDRLRQAIPQLYDNSKSKLELSPSEYTEGSECSPRQGRRANRVTTPFKNKIDTPSSKERGEHVFKQYSGDLFGTRGEYMAGIIYQSRLDPNESPGKQRKMLYPTSGLMLSEALGVSGQNANEQLIDNVKALEETAANSKTWSGATLDTTTPRSEEAIEEAQSATVQAKLHCAQSLATWSKRPENIARLAEEGAIDAALELSTESHLEIRIACGEALMHMSKYNKLRQQLVAKSAVPIISELGASSHTINLTYNCGLTLVHLTLMNNMEAKLVEDGIVIALVNLLSLNDQLAELCVRGLFNLTCVDYAYQYIERVVKAFVSLATSTIPAVKHACAAALCNLSDIRTVRGRVVEEGVVQVVGALARGAEARTRRVCAIVLHLLASTRACRADMVSKGAVQVLYALSSDVDTITLHYIASAVIKLAVEEANLPRLVHEGGVTALCNICLRCPHEASTTQLCASALSLLSQHALGRQAIVQEGCVPAIVTLLHEASDEKSIRNGLAAFSNLLMDEANHEQVLSQGGISAVISLCGHDSSEIREACALALFNLSRGDSSRDAAVSALAVPAIIALSHLPESRTRMRCAATLCKLASVEHNVALMIDADVVPAFIEMLRTRDREIIKHCCTALCRLAHEGTSAATIAQNAVPHVIAGCGEGSDAATRESCCAVLSAVSTHEPCRRALCDMGALGALTSLATDRSADDTTKLRCAVAFANLSNEPAVRADMVKAGIVPVLAELSNSYCEENQLYCARALCNLGCHIGSEAAIVEQGGVAALMMIAMVRAVSNFTKQVCASALLNLIGPKSVRTEWLPKLAQDGLVQAVSVLSRLDEEETLNVCAKIFCTLSAEGNLGRRLLSERKVVLKDMYALMRSEERGTRLLCGKCVCNLLGYADSQPPAVSAGAIPVLARLASLGDEKATELAAAAFFIVSGTESNRVELLSTPGVPEAIAAGAASSHASTRYNSLQVLGQLAWWSSLRPKLIEEQLVSVLIHLSDSLKDNCMLALYAFTYVSFSSEHCKNLDIVSALMKLYPRVAQEEKAPGLFAVALRSLADVFQTTDEENSDDSIYERQKQFVNSGGLRLLCKLVTLIETPALGAQKVLLEHCATALCLVARSQRFSEQLLEDGVLEAIPLLASNPACFAPAAAILHVIALSASHRDALALNKNIRDLLQRLVEREVLQFDPSADSTLISCARTFFWLSRCTSEEARSELNAAGLVPLLIRLSKCDNTHVSTSCSEALKNLATGATGGVEEGTVSTLIAMTLHNNKVFKGKQFNLDSNWVQIPLSVIEPSLYEPPATLLPETLLANFKSYAVTSSKIHGGTAGAGPAAPEPPEMNVQDTLSLAQIGENDFGDTANGDDDSDSALASMMFAKMTIPENLLQPAPLLHGSVGGVSPIESSSRPSTAGSVG